MNVVIFIIKIAVTSRSADFKLAQCISHTHNMLALYAKNIT